MMSNIPHMVLKTLYIKHYRFRSAHFYKEKHLQVQRHCFEVESCEILLSTFLYLPNSLYNTFIIGKTERKVFSFTSSDRQMQLNKLPMSTVPDRYLALNECMNVSIPEY